MGCRFDQIIDRRNTQCVKWDATAEVFGREDLLPLWVADMDFTAPEPVIEAIKARADHGVFGYEIKPQSLDEAVMDWLKTRHNWAVDPNWLSYSPGVVVGLATAILALTEPGDRIVIQPPVYPPFFSLGDQNDRIVVENKLIEKDGRYTMDLVELEEIFRSGVKVMILCSPHNPVGRVWSRDELLALGELATKYDVTVLSDEIWADLVFPGNQHIPLASLSPEIADRVITFMAPSKTFNLAGFYLSNVIIPKETLREKFASQVQRLGNAHSNVFAPIAAEAAYRYGGPWLDELLDYLDENASYVQRELAKIAPKIKVVKPEGTFVLWLDCRELGLPSEELNQFFVEKARLALNDGSAFGESGAGYLRMNIGCPRSLLEEAMKRLAQALEGYKK
ncbi:MAG: pyridoxal phosphate-dependent aminotransferase [Firmicutes bacterium]|nr:pyridoxal phosphate-dependent aminotransferase [Bacillota bacterium]